MKDLRDGEIIHTDKDGKEYVLDENGNHRPPMKSRKISKPGEFTQFDDSEGHCSFCGRLTCRGGCFK
jgi:hypothetical protein